MITTENGDKILTPKGCGYIGIAEIDTSERIREDYGDIKGLAETILDIGLEEPIVITPKKKKLIDGGRRIKAFELLGVDIIPYVTLDVDDLLAAEFVANAARKDFTAQETVTIIEKITETRIGHRPEKGANFALFPKGKTVEVVAKITGRSHYQIQKLIDIVKAARKEPKYKKFLKDVDSGKKSVNTAHKLVTIKERNLPKVPPPEGKYDLLAIDPPWEFENATIRGSAEGHYDVIPLPELCKMELPLTDNAVVFLWVPNSLKYDRIDLDGATRSTLDHLLYFWKLTPKSEFIWYKHKPTPGHYSLTHHETLLLCFKGKPVVPVKRFKSVFFRSLKVPALEHSEKPPEIFEMIQQMYPERKAIEMFAIKPHEGFTPWGDQVVQESSNTSTKK